MYLDVVEFVCSENEYKVVKYLNKKNVHTFNIIRVGKKKKRTEDYI